MHMIITCGYTDVPKTDVLVSTWNITHSMPHFGPLHCILYNKTPNKKTSREIPQRFAFVGSSELSVRSHNQSC